MVMVVLMTDDECSIHAGMNDDDDDGNGDGDDDGDSNDNGDGDGDDCVDDR